MTSRPISRATPRTCTWSIRCWGRPGSTRSSACSRRTAMPELMAIVSKAVFEKSAGKAPKLGTRLAMDRYVSANKNLEPLASGATLYLVTVRPPDEALWLVAVLESPHFDGKQWIAAPCDTPIVDISALR